VTGDSVRLPNPSIPNPQSLKPVMFISTDLLKIHSKIKAEGFSEAAADSVYSDVV
jgi:hypothetical protein